jgi:hypothetical protein
MAGKKKSKHRQEYGDFQTPTSLAERVCAHLSAAGLIPRSVVEPTCGVGNFLFAAIRRFTDVREFIGFEMNPSYVETAKSRLPYGADTPDIQILQEDFFTVDWKSRFAPLREPILILGNPPWVTNAHLGSLGSRNLPVKSNFQGRGGIEAITGKSNFDISEWMILKLLESLRDRDATLALLCKTSVARKVLLHAWKQAVRFSRAEILPIDAAAAFDAAVDACLLVCTMTPTAPGADCLVRSQAWSDPAVSTIGFRDGQLVADTNGYERWKHLVGESKHRWRSGVKHDCAKVMELRPEVGGYRNGHGRFVTFEDDLIYPMLKSSELTDARAGRPSRSLLVTQQTVGEETSHIRRIAPQTWDYLQAYADFLDRRASSIYRNRPRFSIFGIGDYTFAPWKVAISGLYKRLHFVVVGNVDGRPIVLDDTASFLPCQSERDALAIASMLNSAPAREFLSSLIFWDNKRPITIDILRTLDLAALARELGVDLPKPFRPQSEPKQGLIHQNMLFDPD